MCSYTADPVVDDGVDELGSCLCKEGYGGVINGKTTCQDCVTGRTFCVIFKDTELTWQDLPLCLLILVRVASIYWETTVWIVPRLCPTIYLTF